MNTPTKSFRDRLSTWLGLMALGILIAGILMLSQGDPIWAACFLVGAAAVIGVALASRSRGN